MMLLCTLPLIILLLAGGNLFPRGYLWPVLIGGFVVVHFWMMLRGHRSHNDNRSSESKDNLQKQDDAQSADSEHKGHKKQHGGCCH